MPAPFGNYVLERWLAKGGMAEVFLATYTGPLGFEREVALKVILPAYAHHPGFIRMFLDEARLAARLTHPNIVQVYDLGQVRGHFYIAMEYVAGPSLSAALSRARRENRRLRPSVAVAVIIGVLEALSYAHQRRDRNGNPLGIVHRDISAQNILLGFDGQVKLADFGVAKANINLNKTRSGVVKGKYSHMAPEQCMGLPVDERADLFAVGILLHELLTGKPLFSRPSVYATMKAVLEEPIPPPSTLEPDCPAELDGVVLKALDREPSRRWQTAQSFVEALYLVGKRLKMLEDRHELRTFLETIYHRGRINLAGIEEPGLPVSEDYLTELLDDSDILLAEEEESGPELLALEPSQTGLDSLPGGRKRKKSEANESETSSYSPARGPVRSRSRSAAKGGGGAVPAPTGSRRAPAPDAAADAPETAKRAPAPDAAAGAPAPATAKRASATDAGATAPAPAAAKRAPAAGGAVRADAPSPQARPPVADQELEDDDWLTAQVADGLESSYCEDSGLDELSIVEELPDEIEPARKVGKEAGGSEERMTH